MTRRPALALCLLLLLVSTAFASSDADTQKQGSDGSRAIPVHLIPLMAEPLPEQKEGQKITPKDEVVLPFSIRETCSKCHTYEHNYDTISKGWHFNSTDPNAPSGRPGEPWIYVDAATATQIPLSYRSWPGTFRPDQLGIAPFQFAAIFGRHGPGGGPGEIETKDHDLIARQIVSGKLEINCLSCHDGDPAHDQAEYAAQTVSQSFRWAATASASFASVTGFARQMPDTYDYTMPDILSDPEKLQLRPAVTYRPNAFDYKNRIFFNIVWEVPNQRCYFCHSNVDVDRNGLQKWVSDEDVHLAAGMKCVDCHRNGLDHNITRGYQDEAKISTNRLAAVSSCQGCHLGQKSSSQPQAGRLKAPVPKHPGIPPIHFDKLTCTACHSGPWPVEKTCRSKTSRSHALGTYNVNRSADVLPHIVYPVFAAAANEKIAPHKLIWPAYWAVESKDGKVAPIAVGIVKKTVGRIITREKLSTSGSWPSLTAKDIAAILTSLQKTVDEVPVYVCGGKLFRLTDSGELAEQLDHPAAMPYLWPIAHDVRPAAQALGVRRCQDCHAVDAPFFFGKVAVDSPVVSGRESVRKMIEFQAINPFYAWIFAFSFVFRPWLKIVALGCSAVLAVVLLLYGLKALAAVAKVLAEQD